MKTWLLPLHLWCYSVKYVLVGANFCLDYDFLLDCVHLMLRKQTQMEYVFFTSSLIQGLYPCSPLLNAVFLSFLECADKWSCLISKAIYDRWSMHTLETKELSILLLISLLWSLLLKIHFPCDITWKSYSSPRYRRTMLPEQ